MYSNSFRAAAGSSGGKGLIKFALGRFGGTRGGGGAVAAAAPGSVIPSRGRSFSVTPPAPGAQGVGMDLPKQQQQDPVHGDEKNARDGKHKGHWDPMTHSFGEGYATRADEEGFGVVYAKDDDADHHGHPEYDTSQGSEVKEKEKARHHKDDKHAT